jgi:hypothetical protein
MDIFTDEFQYWALMATTGMITVGHYDATGGLSWIHIEADQTAWTVYLWDPIEGLIKVDVGVLRAGSVM